MAGAAATVPVWGWIAAGMILLGIGLWFMIKGDQYQFTPLSYWLNDGSFGKQELLDRDSLSAYATLDEENMGYIQALYSPQKLEEDWHITSNTLTLKIAYPLVGKINTIKMIEIGSSNTSIKNTSSVEKLPSGGSTLSYQITGLTGGHDFTCNVKPSYVPTLLEKI